MTKAELAAELCALAERLRQGREDDFDCELWEVVDDVQFELAHLARQLLGGV
jgi:hypothetical protein